MILACNTALIPINFIQIWGSKLLNDLRFEVNIFSSFISDKIKTSKINQIIKIGCTVKHITCPVIDYYPI